MCAKELSYLLSVVKIVCYLQGNTKYEQNYKYMFN